MKSIVISQSYYFPWVGMLEQIKLADKYVIYDDVQFSRGSFVNRVQIKLPTGSKWLTVPLKKYKFGAKIDEIEFENNIKWKNNHISMLQQSFIGLPYGTEAIDLASDILSKKYCNIGELSRASFFALCNYFGLLQDKEIINSKDLYINGRNSDRVLDIVTALNCNNYITGLGALNYLDHNKFESLGISVEYMNYNKNPYLQNHGEFNPFVTGLDLVANCGKNGIQFINSNTVNWKKIIL